MAGARGPAALVQAGPPPTRRWVLLAGLLLVVGSATAVVHGPVLSSQAICFDDEFYLFDNPVLQNPSWQSARRCMTDVLHSPTVEGYYEPLTLISFMLDVNAGGRPGHLQPFHRSSLALHVVNTLLVTLLLYVLFRDAVAAGMVGLLFGLHPLTVEPVAWVWERKTLLATCFALACLLAYTGYAGRSRRWLYVVSLLMLLLSLLSKPTATLLPVCLILMDVWPLRRFGRKTLLEKVPFFALAGMAAGITILSTAGNASVSVAGQRSADEVLLRMAWLTVFYPAKMLWPAQLSPVYTLPEPLALSSGTVLVAVGAACAVWAGLVIAWRRNRAPVIGWLVYFVLLFPTLGLLHYSWVAASDKYAYLPAAGLLLLLAASVKWVRMRYTQSRRAPGVAVAGAAFMLALAVGEALATRGQIERWRDTETLGKHMVQLAPSSAQAWSRLAAGVSDQGRAEEAIALYARVLDMDPNSAESHYNLAVTLAGAGQIDLAINHYMEAVRLGPGNARAENNLATLLARRGRLEEAISHFVRVRDLRPDTPEPHYNLGNARLGLNQVDEAVKEYQRALECGARRPEVYDHLGQALARRGDRNAAMVQYRAALRLRPDYALAHMNLADALLEDGQTEPALEHYREAVKVEPRNTATHVRLARALERIGQPGPAAEEYRKVLEINPQHAEAQRRLAALPQ